MSPRTPGREPSAAEARAARKAMTRAIRRLNVLEWILLGAAAIASLTGGWLAALLGRSAFDLPFRATWLIASLLLFLIPGGVAMVAERRSRRAPPKDESNESKPAKRGR